MFKKSKICAAALLALSSSIAMHAFAQEQLEKVEVTGSAIKRVDAETSVPVTVLKAAELQKEGITTIEQALAMLSGNQTSQGTSQSVGLSTGGAAFADLRGLGQNKTLVLLNGRRIANNAFDGTAPDLNMIPFAALERVEVLRDGASSLYGTDAIGGVINFITRKDMAGGVLNVGADSPQHTGGSSANFNVGYGFGNLAQDKFNLLMFADYQNQNELRASQRSFSTTGYVPSMGLTKSSANAFPSNYYNQNASDPSGNSYVFANPSAPNCTNGMFTRDGATCRFDYSHYVDDIPDTQRASGMIRGAIAVNADTQVNLEYFVAHSEVKTQIAPVPFAGYAVNPGTAFYPGMGITPLPTAAQSAGLGFDPTQPIDVYFRDVPNGDRRDKSVNLQQRFVAELEGNYAGWDYNTALSFNQNQVDYSLTGGYASDSIISNGLMNGTINPFGTQTAAGTALLNSALEIGPLLTARARVYQFDAHGSRSLGDWFGAGNEAQVALGIERRHESLYDKVPGGQINFATQVSASTGIDPNTNQSGKRDVTAAFGELNVPLTKQLEVTAAVRGDKYSDFGSSVNPKFSVRYQPTRDLLIRSSVTSGFRAPGLYDLYAPQTYTNTANPYNDPVNCPNGTALPGQNPLAVCNTQFMALTGGNPHLNAETSRSATFGVVFSPMANTTIGLDFWWIRLQHSIGSLSQDAIFGNPTKYASLFHYNPAGNLSINGSVCPGVNCGYVLDTEQNLGGTNTNGVDVNFATSKKSSLGTLNFTFNGTYVTNYDYQLEENGAWFNNAGIYSNGSPVFRWQHTAQLNWSRDAWSAGLVNRFKSNYNDQNSVAAPYNTHIVGSYSLFDLYGSYKFTNALTLTAGIRNLFDQNPPFSNQGATFQQGFDPRYTDPLGRVFYARGTYKF